MWQSLPSKFQHMSTKQRVNTYQKSMLFQDRHPRHVLIVGVMLIAVRCRTLLIHIYQYCTCTFAGPKEWMQFVRPAKTASRATQVAERDARFDCLIVAPASGVVYCSNKLTFWKMALVSIIYRIYVHTSQRTQCLFNIRTIISMLCRDKLSSCYCKRPLKKQKLIVWEESRVRSVNSIFI